MNMKRRAWHHDYHARQFILITLTTLGRRPLLGAVAGRSDGAPATPQAPHVVLTPLGEAVAKAWDEIPLHDPELDVVALQIMPDHLHGILHVKQKLNRHLGRVVMGFKISCTHALRSLIGDPSATLWSQGYNDSILYPDINLDTWKNYLRDNPRRLLLKRENPQLFTTRHEISRAGHTFAALGNLLLLDYPMKHQVQCSRRASAEEIADKSREALDAALRGAVIVSPAISFGEKAIVKTIHEAGFPLILLQYKGLTAFSRPTKALLGACTAGRLLMLSLGEPTTRHTVITRDQCLALNAAARALCSPLA